MSLVLWAGGRKAQVAHLTQVADQWVRDPKQLPEIAPHDTVLVCGEQPASYLRKHKVFHKTKALSTLLHNPAENVYIPNDQVITGMIKDKPVFESLGPCNVVVTPALGLYGRSPEVDYQIHWGFELACRLENTGSIQPDLSPYTMEYRKGLKQLIYELRQRYEREQRPIPIALDLETDGLDPWKQGAHIVTVQLSIDESSAVVLRQDQMVPTVWNQLRMILRSPKVRVIGANLQFDILWLRIKQGIEVKSFAFDVQLADSLLCVWRSHALQHMTKNWVPELGGYDTLDLNKANMREELAKDPAKFLQYAGGDTIAALRVANKQKEALISQPPRRSKFYNLLHRANKAFTELQYRGICIDKDKWDQLKQQNRQAAKAEFDKALNILPLKLRLEYKGAGKFTPAQLRKILFTEAGFNLKPLALTGKTRAPSTSGPALADYKNHPEAGPFIEAILQKAKLEKIVSTYLVGFEKHLRRDGKFHPSYMQAHTSTGRLSASSPAMLTLPKHSAEGKALRNCYVPPSEDYAIMQADFDAGELKVIANIADVPKMKKVFREGMDIHMVTGMSMVGPNSGLTDKEIRQRGKTANFGIIYRIAEKGLQTYAKESFFVDITLAQASAYIDKFLVKDYPEISSYHDRQERFVRQYGYVESPIGRVRHLHNINWPDKGSYGAAVRAAINTPVQSTLSDCCQLALAIINERYPELQCFLFFHDALLFYVKKDELELWEQRVVEVMENLPLEDFGWRLDLPLTASAEFGMNMSEDYSLAQFREKYAA